MPNFSEGRDAAVIEALCGALSRPARLLDVPHRDLGERLFVLAPLADLAPRLVPPGWRHTVESRRRDVAATEPADAVRPVARWSQGRWISLD